jgi:drug/metabolite transporter (DMT)-like permease
MQRKQNLRAVILMLAAVGLFSIMDAGLKILSPHYPAMQVAALRGLSSLPLIVVYVAWRGQLPSMLRVRWSLHVLRGVLAVTMLASFTFALRTLPLAEAYSIFFVAPLLITVLSMPFLGERVGRARWWAIVVGFVGVLVVLRPTGAGMYSLAGLAVLAAAACYSISAITVRIIGRTDNNESLVFWMVLMLSVGASALAAPHWTAIQSQHWPVIAGIGVIGFVAQLAITEAFRRGEASFNAPLEYSALAWGAGLDWLLWKTLPDAITLIGAGIIVASGIYLIRGEHAHAEAEHP